MSEKAYASGVATPDHSHYMQRSSYEGMSIGEYAKTRFTTLKPRRDPVPNPFKLLGLLNTKQWLFFLVSFSLLETKTLHK